MKGWSNRGRCCVRRMKTLVWFETSLPARISSIVHRHTNDKRSNMHSMYGIAQGNGLHSTDVQHLLNLRKEYLLLYVIQVLSLKELRAIAYIMPRNIKWSTEAQLPMKTFKWSAMQHILSGESFHVHRFKSRSISLNISVQERKVGKLHIGVTMHVTRNLYAEWRFKPPKYFYPHNSTTPYFRNHTPIRNLLT